MTVPQIACTHLAGAADRPLLVVGPSLGTSAAALWMPVAQLLADTHCVVGWDLPGHGASPSPHAPFTLADLAKAVAETVESELGVAPFTYAGVSIGGAVGMHLLLDYSNCVSAAALICTGPVIGQARDWRDRARHVRADGTAAMATAAQQRWFARGFGDREPQTVAALLESLCKAHDEGYAACCEALADFDVRDRLAQIDTPVLAIAGSDDVATPPKSLLELSKRVRGGRFVELAGTAHLAPAESPRRIAQLVASLAQVAR